MYLNVFELTLIYQLITFIIIAACTSLVQWYARHRSNIDIKLSFETGWVDKIFGFGDYARCRDNIIAIALSALVALLGFYPTFSNVIFKPHEMYEFLNTSRYLVPNIPKLGLVDMSSITCSDSECALDAICKNIDGCGLGYGLGNYTLSPSAYEWSSNVITSAVDGTITTPDQQIWTFGLSLYPLPLLDGTVCKIQAVTGTEYKPPNVSFVDGYGINGSSLECIPQTQANINVFVHLDGPRNNMIQIAYGDEYLTLNRPTDYRAFVARRYVQSTELKCFTNYSCSRATTIAAEVYGYSNTPINLRSICQQHNFNDSKMSEVCSVLLSLQVNVESNDTTVMQAVSNTSNSLQFMAYSKAFNQKFYSFSLDYKNMTIVSYYNIINYTNTRDLSIVLSYNDSGVIYDNEVDTRFGYMDMVSNITGYFDNLGHMNWFDGPLHNIIVDLATHVNETEITVAAAFYRSVTGISPDSGWVSYILVIFLFFFIIKCMFSFVLEPYWTKPLRTTLLSAASVSGPSTLDVVYTDRMILLVNGKYQLTTSQSEETVSLTTF